MKEVFNINEDDLRCEEKCNLKWVECMEKEEGSYICKTIENNCNEDCEGGYSTVLED